MKAKIAVATVSGKAYYLIVDELKKRNVPFISITPYEPVPMEIKVVLTTERERPLINHENVLTLKEGEDPQTLGLHQGEGLAAEELAEKEALDARAAHHYRHKVAAKLPLTVQRQRHAAAKGEPGKKPSANEEARAHRPETP